MDVSALQPGVRLSGWQLVRCLGRSTPGTSWIAEDEDGRAGLVRVLPRAPARASGALARVQHPALPEVLGGGATPVYHVITRLVAGRPLSDFLRGGAAPPSVAMGVALVLADALAALHRAGLFHGDLNPEQVRVESIRGPELTLCDAGLVTGRRSGVLAYAAPERLQGAPPSAEADCYSLGLLLWEMLHGRPPWPELPQSEALLQRAQAAPEPSAGSPLLGELLRSLLQPSPGARPDAAQIADRLLRLGAPEVRAGAGMVYRRARRLRVFSPLVSDAVQGWLERGGRLALVGSPGSGRSHVLEHLARESQARGPAVRLDSSERPWAAVERALHSHGLPGGPVELPYHPDPERRAELVAEALLARCPDGFAVFIDDFGDQDSSVHLVAEALAQRGAVRIAVAGTQAPPWSTDQCLLEPMDLEGLRALLRGLLGPVRGGQRLAEQLHTRSEGLPGAALAYVVSAIEGGALCWRAQRWQVDPERTAHMLAEEPAELLRLPALSDDAEALGGALALLELPVSLDYLPPLVNLPEERLRIAREELLDRGLARLEGRQLGCRSLPIAHALASRIPQPERLHRVVVEQLLRQHAPDLVRLGWHLVGARDASRIERHGEEILAAAVLRDGAEAAALAEELWAICPCERLVAPRMHALRAAGRTSDARRLGEGLLGGRAPCPADLPLLVELARIHIGSEGRDDLALRCVERARLAGEGGDLPPELVHAEAWIHHRAGRFEEALAAARPLAEGEPPAGPEELERWMRLRVVWARALHGMGRSEEALALLEPLPESLGQGRRDRALLDITQGGLLLELGRQRDAIDALERAAHTDSGLAAAARAEQWYTAAVLRHELGDLRGALVGLERALPLLERLDEPRMRVRVQSRLCVLYRELARWDRAVEAGSWALHSARELGDERRAALAASRLADVFLAQGSWREAQRWISRAEGLAREHGLSDLLAPLLRRRAELAVQRQDPRATALAEHARAKALEAGDEREQASSSVLLAFCHARAGRAEQLDQVGNPALEILKRVGGGALAEARLWLAEAYLLVGRMENALATGNQALVYADEVGHEQLRRRAHSLVGRVRDIRGGGFADDRLERLLELTVAVAEERVLQRIFEAIAAAALDLLSAEHVHVLVSGEDGEARVVASAVAEGADDQAPPGPVVQRALQEGREVFAADLGERPELWDAREGALPDLRSALCVPLAQGGERFGALYVGSHAMPSSELQQVARLLRALAAFGSVAALNARHMDETARRAEKAAELAHDLRTPASAIHVVVSGLLAAKSDDDPERDVLMRVLEAAQRIRSMAGGILDEGRPGARPVLMSNLVERMVGLLRHVASQRGVRLELAVRPGLWVDGDPQELSRLVTNLVSNALKYAPKGSRIAVGLAQDDRGLVLLVRDQGPGIPKGSEETIFHRGHQAEGAGPGHGLGLYICQRIVKEHGGSISARNHRRGGAVFTVRLPRRVRAWDSLPQHAV